ncbi:MAG: efflux RND transporter periplasmic adaptor subunit [Verrucomicrobiota bacterium]|nr:efflux RND transporter periplasmic adaptor subunit [Verrucomicrobiota bacterium]
MGKLRKIVWAILGLIGLGLLLFSFRPEPVPVELGASSRGEMQVVVSQDGKTRVRDRFVLYAPANGVISRVELQEGDRIEVGQVCATIQPLASALLDERSQAEAQARLEAARALVERASALAAEAEAATAFADTELQRMELQAKGGVISDEALAAARFESRRRELELESARLAVTAARYEEAALAVYLEPPSSEALKVVELRSPVAGCVLLRHRESAGPIQLGTPILEVGDPDGIEIVVDFLSQDAVRVAPGDPVWIRRWGGQDVAALAGTVQRVEPSGFTHISALGVEEQRVNVIIDPASTEVDGWNRIGDGYRVDVDVIVWAGQDVLRVPSGAVFRREQQWSVFLVEEGVARIAPVEIGARSDDWVQILTGLEADVPLIVYPPEELTDGGKVVALGEKEG